MKLVFAHPYCIVRSSPSKSFPVLGKSPLAQWLAYQPSKLRVAGSSPAWGGERSTTQDGSLLVNANGTGAFASGARAAGGGEAAREHGVPNERSGARNCKFFLYPLY